MDRQEQLRARINALSPEQRASFIKKLTDAGIDSSSFEAQAAQVSENRFSTSDAQKRMYYLQKLAPDSTAYNISNAWRLKGEVNAELVKSSFDMLVNRHETLRSSFVVEDALLMQRIHSIVEYEFQLEESVHENLEDCMHSFIRPFDYGKVPLFRVRLVKDACSFIFQLDIAHIIADGYSLDIILRELAELYEGKFLTSPPWQLRQHATILRENESTRNEHFWKSAFCNAFPAFSLPFDSSKDQTGEYAGNKISIHCDGDLHRKLKGLAAVYNTSLFSLLLAVLELTISRWTGHDDVIIAITDNGRNLAGETEAVGMFATVLPIRVLIDKDSSFDLFFRNFNGILSDFYRHKDYPIERIFDLIEDNKPSGVNTMVQVLFNSQDFSGAVDSIGKIKVEALEIDRKTATFPFTVYSKENANGIDLHVTYRSSLFNEGNVSYLISQYQKLLSLVCETPHKKIRDYEIFVQANTEVLNDLGDFNRQKFNIDSSFTSVTKYIDDTVAQYPEEIAVIFESQTLTYRELNNRANCIANLIQRVTPAHSNVALLFEQGVDIVVASLAVLKTGFAYVPLDPGFPQDRLTYILADSDVTVIITNTRNLTYSENIGTPNIRVVNIDQIDYLENATHATEKIAGSDIALLLYTSGSTGRPKGVIQTQANLTFFILSYSNYIKFDEQDRLALFSSYSHAVGVIDILASLVNGSAIVIYSLAQSDIAKLPMWLHENKITIYHSVPSVYRAFLATKVASKLLDSVRLIILGGEEVTSRDLELWRNSFSPESLFVNFFGASEILISCFDFWRMDRATIQGRLPVGYPIAGVNLKLVTSDGRIANVLEPGEIVYDSPFLSPGYWKLPEQTQKVIGANSFRSGDLGRILPNGKIEHLGRVDFQVKINGNRIDLLEVEEVIKMLPEIVQAAVVAKKLLEDRYTLVAYFVSHAHIEPESIRAHCRRVLPHFMVPAHFLSMKSFPLTATGKLDRNALPNPALFEIPASVQVASSIQKKVIAAFSDVLDIARDSIHIDSDFFKLGGHSLKLIQVVSNLHREFDVQLNLRDLFVNATVRSVADLVASSRKKSFTHISRVQHADYYPLSSAQLRLFLIEQTSTGNLAYNLPGVYLICGMLDKNRFVQSLNSLVERHEILRTSFEMRNNVPVQVVHNRVSVILEVYTANSHDELGKLFQSFTRPFDMRTAPLLRAALVRIAEQYQYLLFDIHHIISDGSSTKILLDDLIALYDGNTLEPVKIHYKDYAQWQLNFRSSKEAEAMKQHWLRQFEGATKTLDLPGDFERPQVFTYEGAVVTSQIDRDSLSAFVEIGEKYNATAFMSYLAVLNILLTKYTGSDVIIVGNTIFGRPHSDLDTAVGLFVNELALLNRPTADKTYVEFLKEVKESCISSFENQFYQFEDLVHDLQIPRDSSRNPLFNVCFSFQNFRRSTAIFSELEFKPVKEFANKAAKFDLTFTIVEEDDTLHLTIEYYRRIFKRDSIEKMSKYYREIIRQITQNPNIKINEIRLLNSVVAVEQPNIEFNFEI